MGLVWRSDGQLARTTGCLRPCTYRDYPIERSAYVRRNNKSVPDDGDAAIDFVFDESVLEVEEEYVAYDAFSLLGEVGGAVGLFLGWSVRGAITAAVAQIWKK